MHQEDHSERLVVLILFLFLIAAATFVAASFHKLINLF